MIAVLVVVGFVTAAADAAPAPRPPLSAKTAVVDPMPRGKLVRSGAATFEAADVWLYGDSITVQSWRNLTVRGGLAVDAYWGRGSLPTAQRLAADLRAHTNRPRVVVMAVGTNDFARPADLTRAIEQARRASVRYGFELVWVTVYSDNRADEERLLNARIRAGGPLVEVADWYGLLAAHAGPDGKSPWLSDGRHLNREGALWRTNLLARAISTAQGPPS